LRNALTSTVAFLVLVCLAGPLLAAPVSPEFYKTMDSDGWVSHTIKVQSEYSRVLVVTTGVAPETVSVAPLDLNSREPKGAAREYKVAASFQTMQEAADAAKGGDLVAVMPGTYSGFALEDKADAGDGKYIHFKAMGRPGEVTINAPAAGKDRNWMVMFAAAHHAILEGFNIAGATGPGLEQKGPQSGIFIAGGFVETGKLAHHIVILNNFSHNHRGWGLHSVDTHTVLMQGNCFALSSREHSAYVSDGSDNYCIRRNVFFGSTCSGLQCNLDPLASLDKLVQVPGLTEFKDAPKTPEMAQKLLKAATDKFGANNFPDGQGFNFIIEDNVVNENGKKGGGSLNLAGLKDSVIQNNLIYNNLTTGIAMWDNGNEWDAGLASPGPSSDRDVNGPESLPFWGCQRNVIRNNTVVMNVKGRPGIGLGNGSWGNVLRNNIVLNDLTESLDISNTSVYKTDSGWNVLNKVALNDMAETMLGLAVAMDEKNHSTANAALDKAAPDFVRMNTQPWIIVEGNWWRLNPDRPDFHPKKGSELLVGTGESKQLPPRDIDGAARKSADMGAYCGK
jgi:hypothetical protein